MATTYAFSSAYEAAVPFSWRGILWMAEFDEAADEIFGGPRGADDALAEIERALAQNPAAVSAVVNAADPSVRATYVPRRGNSPAVVVYSRFDADLVTMLSIVAESK